MARALLLIAVVAGLLVCQALANPGDYSIYVDTSEDPINNPVAPVDAGSFTTVTGASSIDVVGRRVTFRVECDGGASVDDCNQVDAGDYTFSIGSVDLVVTLEGTDTLIATGAVFELYVPFGAVGDVLLTGGSFDNTNVFDVAAMSCATASDPGTTSDLSTTYTGSHLGVVANPGTGQFDFVMTIPDADGRHVEASTVNLVSKTGTSCATGISVGLSCDATVDAGYTTLAGSMNYGHLATCDSGSAIDVSSDTRHGFGANVVGATRHIAAVELVFKEDVKFMRGSETFNEVRTVTEDHLFFIDVATKITTTAEITIYAEPNFDLIVTAQEIGINTFAVDPSDPNADAGTASMTVTFTTLLQTPFELSSLDAHTGGSGTAPTTATISGDSPVVGTNTVRQPGHQFTYVISTPSNPCDFSLTYDLKGTVGCVSGTTNCPLSTAQQAEEREFSITIGASDVCTAVGGALDSFTATVTTYEVSGGGTCTTTASGSFLEKSSACFGVAVDNPAGIIDKAVISHITTTDLYPENLPTPPSSYTALASQSSGTVTDGVVVSLAQDLDGVGTEFAADGDIEPDSTETMSFTLVIDVAYANAGKRRQLLQSAETATFTKSLSILPAADNVANADNLAGNTQTAAAASGANAGVVIAAIIGGVVLLVGVVAVVGWQRVQIKKLEAGAAAHRAATGAYGDKSSVSADEDPEKGSLSSDVSGSLSGSLSGTPSAGSYYTYDASSSL